MAGNAFYFCYFAMCKLWWRLRLLRWIVGRYFFPTLRTKFLGNTTFVCVWVGVVRSDGQTGVEQQNPCVKIDNIGWYKRRTQKKITPIMTILGPIRWHKWVHYLDILKATISSVQCGTKFRWKIPRGAKMSKLEGRRWVLRTHFLWSIPQLTKSKKSHRQIVLSYQVALLSRSKASSLHTLLCPTGEVAVARMLKPIYVTRQFFVHVFQAATVLQFFHSFTVLRFSAIWSFLLVDDERLTGYHTKCV